MGNNTVLHELQIKVSAIQENEKKINALHKKIKILLKDIKKTMIPWLNEVYSQWRPHINEPVVRVDFGAMTAFELFVTEISGIHVRAREGDKNAYHRFSLHNKVEDYETATFILPVSIYKELSGIVDFSEYPTLRYDKKRDKFYDEKPDYFK